MKQTLLKNLRLRLCMLVAILCSAGSAWGETETLVSGSGTSGYTVPTGWESSGTVEGGSYLKFDDGTITSPSFNPHTGLSFTYSVATFGSGTNHPLTIRILNASTNAVIIEETTSTPTSSTYITTGSPISLGDVNVAFKIQFYAPTGKGVRLRNYSVTGTPAGGEVTPTCANPTFDPAEGTYTSAQTVTISTATSGATIYYTTDGSTPTTSSSVYSAAISVDETTTIKAIASADGYNNSAVASATYTINLPYSGEDYVRVSSKDYLTDGAKVIIAARYNTSATSYYAMTASASGKPTGVAFTSTTSDNGEILPESIVNSENTYYWTVGVTPNGYTFTNANNQTLGYTSSTNFATNGNNTEWVIARGTSKSSAMVSDYEGFYITNKNNNGRAVALNSSHNYGPYDTSNINNNTYNFYVDIFVQGATPAEDPSIISANNLELNYNATSSSISYSVENPVTGGTLTAVSSASWLNVEIAANDNIALTCGVNTDAVSRTATVTLTYTYNTNETVTKAITVTQAGNPNIVYTTIPALFNAATSTEASVNVTFNNWVVSGVSTNGKNVFVTDNVGNGFVIYYSSDMSGTFSAGNILSGTVACGLKLYNGFAELVNLNPSDLTITSGGTVTVSNIAMADLAGVNTGALVSYENLTCSVDNNKYYLTDGTTTIQVYNSLYTFDALTAGKIYNITGIYQQYTTNSNNTKEILPRSAEDIEEVATPTQTIITAGTLTNVSINQLWNGDSFDDINLNENVEEGTMVYFSLNVDEGYNLESVTVLDANNTEVSLTEASGSWWFTMPGSSVTINATAISTTPATGDQYALFTDALVEGDYIIYYDGYAMNTTVTSDRLQYEEVTPTNDVVTTDNAAIVWHIAPSGDYWTIYNADANAYAASTGAKNKAQMLADGTDDKALWAVSGTGTYEFVNKKNTANNVNANLRNNGTYGFACYASSTGGALSLYKKVEAEQPITVTVGSAGYTTYVTPAAVSFPVGVEAFIVTAINASSMHMDKVTAVPANTPIVVKAAADTYELIEFAEEPNNVSGNLLQASDGTVQGGSTIYVLANKSKGVGFYPTATTITIPRGKAYLDTSATGHVKEFIAFDFGGIVTGIDNVNMGESDALIFNLAGQRVNKATKGLYIVNGKKVIMK